MRLPTLRGLQQKDDAIQIRYAWIATHEGLRVAALDAGMSLAGISRELGTPLVGSLLEQLAGDGLASREEDSFLLTWPHVHEVLRSRAYETSVGLLDLPPEADCVPRLQSRGSLADSHFEIRVSGWVAADGTSVSVEELSGAILRANGQLVTLPAPVWRLMEDVRRFASRGPNERTAEATRRRWGEIRARAIEAGAHLDQFLVRSVVVTPETLNIDFRRTALADTSVVEIAPSFEGAPERWLEFFDKQHDVPASFNIPTAAGVVHVALSEPVRTVLREVKRWPGRRAAGQRAEAFLLNPVAALGSDAQSVIDIGQFEEAKAQAGIAFERFRPFVENDAAGFPARLGLDIDSPDGGTKHCSFASDEEARTFANELAKRLRNGLQILAWKDFEFVLDGDAPRHLETLQSALAERAKPPVEIRRDRVFDLANYSDRITGIGADVDYISAYIVKRKEDDGWFPANLIPVLKEGTAEAGSGVGVPILPEDVPDLQKAIQEARERGETTVAVPGFEKPLNIDTVERAVEKIAQGLASAEPPKPDSAPETLVEPKERPTLLIKGNIDAVEHIEDRAEALHAAGAVLYRPKSLKPSVDLREHQQQGIARLQHLFAASPKHCRGVLLADDMGLGKTLQLLTFLASAFERDPSLRPALIVAPVSLLENWKQEVENFFEAGSLRILTAYGDELTKLRVPRESVDEALRKEGLVKFLKEGWRGDAQIVLTTYETLRDLEFSFAQEPWSVLVCDEAQKIKNPNAMVTRAAKKLNVRFRVACTGTPVENSLVDIWCLFDLIQPGLLGALNEFGKTYGRPIETSGETANEQVEALRRLIEPQIIRRTKADVAKDLPAKILVPDLRLEMSAEQRSLYVGALSRIKAKTDEEADSADGLHHFTVLQYLRLVCADPRDYGIESFAPEDSASYRRKAPKMDWLLQTLRGIRSKAEKVLVFAERRDIQLLLQHYIHAEFGFRPQIVNGDTVVSANVDRSRQKIISAFQRHPGFSVLILSPVAVGFGVNIQAANHVIHYLRHWNPAKEDQATDRAYRIGQTKDVHVYCPLAVARDFKTFDVKLDELLSRKRALATDMLRPPGDVSLFEMDIEDILPPGAELPPDAPVTLDVMERMNGRALEGLAAVLWRKQGFNTQLTPPSDAGVDVVGIRGNEGVLIQCKSSTRSRALGWEAVRDVKGGSDIYADQFPLVRFRKIGLTNQRFNATAKARAQATGVILIEQPELWALVEKHPISMQELSKALLR